MNDSASNLNSPDARPVFPCWSGAAPHRRARQRYRALQLPEQVGEGGFGVGVANNGTVKRRVALKIIKLGHETGRGPVRSRTPGLLGWLLRARIVGRPVCRTAKSRIRESLVNVLHLLACLVLGVLEVAAKARQNMRRKWGPKRPRCPDRASAF